MLFYPQSKRTPLRVQGTFVSDKEIENVVEFVKNQMIEYYGNECEDKIIQSPIAHKGSYIDQYFVQAGKFVIEKEKASIGMIQRIFKIGFNRAARIMDQLEDAGVVGQEEGTKPRKILMSMEQFEQYIEECL